MNILLIITVFVLQYCSTPLPSNTNGTISGRLIDKNGDPIHGAIAQINTGQTTITLEDGSYYFDEVEAGKEYQIIIYHPDYLRDTLSVEELTIKAEYILPNKKMVYRYSTINGFTRNAKGEPLGLSGVSVEFQDASRWTGPSGDFRLSKVHPGEITLYFSKDGFGWGDTVITVLPDSEYFVDLFQEKEGGTVSGTLLDPDGTLLPSAIVTAMAGGAMDTSDSKGNFTLNNLPTDIDLNLTIANQGDSLKIGGIRTMEESAVDIGEVLTSPTTEKDPGEFFIKANDVLLSNNQSEVILNVSPSINIPNFGYFWDLNGDGEFEVATENNFLKVNTKGLELVKDSKGNELGYAQILVTLDITDNSENDTADIRVYFPENRLPIFSGAGKYYTERGVVINPGEPFLDTINVFDPDGENSSIELVLLESHLQLTQIKTNVVQILSVPDSAGFVEGQIQATDNRGGITILPLKYKFNQVPIFIPPNQPAEIGQLFQIQLEANDLDGDSIWFRPDSIPDGASLTQNQFQWTPTRKDSGRATIKITVGDEYGLARAYVYSQEVR